MAQFGHTSQSCIACRRDYGGKPPCDINEICERFTKLRIDDETFPTVELPIVRDIIRLWSKIVTVSPVTVLEGQEKKGDKVVRKKKFIPSLSNLDVWVETFDFERWGINRKQLLEWLTLFHSEYVNELRAK